MAVSILNLPVQYVRQQAEPIDVDSVFASTAARNAYLTNPRRYPGQIVGDTQSGNIYMLDAAASAWISVLSNDVAAANGLSLAASQNIQLGQAFGAEGNPGALTQNTEIPFAGNALVFTDTDSESNQTEIVFESGVVSFANGGYYNVGISVNSGGNFTLQAQNAATFSEQGISAPPIVFGGSSWNTADANARNTTWRITAVSDTSTNSGQSNALINFDYSDNGGDFITMFTINQNSSSVPGAFHVQTLVAEIISFGGGVAIAADSTSIVAIGEGPTPTALRIHNNGDAEGNGEYGELGWVEATNIFTINVGATGTGTLRTMAIISQVAFATAVAPSADIDVVHNSLGAVVPTDAQGIALTNNTTATNSIQGQSSPGLRFKSSSWNTIDNVAYTVNWKIYSEAAASGIAASATSPLNFDYNIGSGYATIFQILQTGATLVGQLNVSTSVNSAAFGFNQGLALNCLAAGRLETWWGESPTALRIMETDDGVRPTANQGWYELGFIANTGYFTIAPGQNGTGVERPIVFNTPSGMLISPSLVQAPNSVVEINHNALGTSTAGSEGLTLSNYTAATSGSQSQYSPGILFEGSGWNTADVAAHSVRGYMFLAAGTLALPGLAQTTLIVNLDQGDGTFTEVMAVSTNILSIPGTAQLPNIQTSNIVYGGEVIASVVDTDILGIYGAGNVPVGLRVFNSSNAGFTNAEYLDLSWNIASNVFCIAVGASGTGTLRSLAFTSPAYFGSATAPTATIHIAANSTTAGSAPIKFGTGGTVMTTPEAQAVEVTDTHIYWTNTAGSRFQLDQQSTTGPGNIVVVTDADHTIISGEQTIIMTTITADRVCNLPVADSSQINRTVRVVCTNPGSFQINIVSASANIIQATNAAITNSVAVNTPGYWLEFTCDGANWYITAGGSTI